MIYENCSSAHPRKLSHTKKWHTTLLNVHLAHDGWTVVAVEKQSVILMGAVIWQPEQASEPKSHQRLSWHGENIDNRYEGRGSKAKTPDKPGIEA